MVTGLSLGTGPRSLSASWQASASTGVPASPLTYEVRYGTGTQSEQSTWPVETAGAERSYTIAGLTAGTEYQVQVRCAGATMRMARRRREAGLPGAGYELQLADWMTPAADPTCLIRKFSRRHFRTETPPRLDHPTWRPIPCPARLVDKPLCLC